MGSYWLNPQIALIITDKNKKISSNRSILKLNYSASLIFLDVVTASALQ